MPSVYSIRTLLLLWLIVPMSLLILVDSVVLYQKTHDLELKIFDHELEDLSNDVSIFIKNTNTSSIKGLDADAQALLFNDAEDKTYYALYKTSGELITGNADIARAGDWIDIKPNQKKFFNSVVHEAPVRVISAPLALALPDGKHQFLLLIAETIHKRTSVRDHILLWIVFPQMLLLFAAGFSIVFGIKKGLHPLVKLNTAISALSFKDLRPISVANTPKEINKLVESINRLTHQLDEAMNAQNRFVADVAHQLRTPLAGIFAQIEAATNSKDVQNIQQRLRFIAIGSDRLTHMVNQLLRLAKNQTEIMQHIVLEPLDLVSLVKKVCLELSPNADLKQIDLGYDGETHAVMILGDSLRLHDLVYNLLDNAIKYTADGGKVTASVFIQDHFVCLTIEDNGHGIPQDEQHLVFDRFYRGKTAEGFGTGVGLSIVKDVAALHGASIHVDSHPDNLGTKIVISFKRNH